MQNILIITITLSIIALVLYCIFRKKSENFENTETNEITEDMGLPKIEKNDIPTLSEIKELEVNLFDAINSDAAIKNGCNPKSIELIKKALRGEESLEKVGNYFLKNRKEADALKDLVYKI